MVLHMVSPEVTDVESSDTHYDTDGGEGLEGRRVLLTSKVTRTCKEGETTILESEVPKLLVGGPERDEKWVTTNIQSWTLTIWRGGVGSVVYLFLPVEPHKETF